MAEAIKPSPVKLIIGAIFASEGILIKARQRLERKFGPVDFQSPAIPFDFTDYYRQEMGPNLTRRFFSFQRLIKPDELAAIKLYTNRLEAQFSRRQEKSSRSINLDPGYISQAKLVLASCKNYYHRIYLGKGVFAEIALYFQEGSFKFHPWTYPDYKSASYIKSFTAIREIYRRQ
ncbi:MAG: DUF4416 family protein [Candidatus Omnitrophota bacterium]|nr:MAG: DUF4416 family protein [Candidatus Omnitrophota bacterium]